MAQLLLLAVDIAKNGRQEGDPVGVFDDSHIFGEREDKRVWLAKGNTEQDWLGTFYVIEILGMPLSVAKRFYDVYKRPANILEPEFSAPDAEDRYIILGRHRWQLGVADKIPGPAKTALRRDGFLSFPYDIPTINDYMIDRSGLDTFVPDGEQVDP